MMQDYNGLARFGGPGGTHSPNARIRGFGSTDFYSCTLLLN